MIQQYHSWGYTQKTVTQVTPETPAHPEELTLTLDSQPPTEETFCCLNWPVCDTLHVW
jgi:hypothetical protein